MTFHQERSLALHIYHLLSPQTLLTCWEFPTFPVFISTLFHANSLVLVWTLIRTCSSNIIAWAFGELMAPIHGTQGISTHQQQHPIASPSFSAFITFPSSSCLDCAPLWCCLEVQLHTSQIVMEANANSWKQFPEAPQMSKCSNSLLHLPCTEVW